MKNQRPFTFMLFFFLLAGLYSCSGIKGSSSSMDQQELSGNSNQADMATVQPDQAHLTLAEYLKRMPGVTVEKTVNGTELRLRGGQGNRAFGGAPLYVLDGHPISNNYDQIVDMVHVANIKKVTVIRDVSETSFYGARGQNGVIEIVTKQQ